MQSFTFQAPHLELKPIERSKPRPGKGEVLLRVAASGINPIDLKILNGKAAYARVNTGDILGIDTAGTIEELGEGITTFETGDAVYGMAGGVGSLPGSLAEWMVCDARLLAKKPEGISFREAASLPLVSITAWEGLVDRGRIKPGDTVLVHAGAGGVGNLAIQLAKVLGAQVWATGSEKDQIFIESFGAHFIDYRNCKVEEYVKQHTDDIGFDLVFDTVGGKTLDDSFLAVKKRTGIVISCVGWAQHSLAPLSFRGATYSGVYTLDPLLSGEGRLPHGQILREIEKYVTAKRIVPSLHSKRFKLSETNQAYALAATKKERGKIVIEVE